MAGKVIVQNGKGAFNSPLQEATQLAEQNETKAQLDSLVNL
jgi:hypothetical protein